MSKKKSNKNLVYIVLGVILILIVAIILKFAVFNTNSESKVLIKTTKGDITVELYPEQAPITVENFLSYVNDDSYDNTVFHRVIKGFMVQGGGFETTGTQKPTKAPIILESNNDLKNEIGTLAMARTGDPNSATNQFFINTANNEFLNYGVRDSGYAVFGKVVKGMEIVTEIENSKTTIKNSMQDWPVEDIIILEISTI